MYVICVLSVRNHPHIPKARACVQQVHARGPDRTDLFLILQLTCCLNWSNLPTFPGASFPYSVVRSIISWRGGLRAREEGRVSWAAGAARHCVHPSAHSHLRPSLLAPGWRYCGNEVLFIVLHLSNTYTCVSHSNCIIIITFISQKAFLPNCIKYYLNTYYTQSPVLGINSEVPAHKRLSFQWGSVHSHRQTTVQGGTWLFLWTKVLNWVNKLISRMSHQLAGISDS